MNTIKKGKTHTFFMLKGISDKSLKWFIGKIKGEYRIPGDDY